MKPHHASSRAGAVHLGFQIAPMVDVVFVVLLFFMVLAGSVPTEKRHLMCLPVRGEPLKLLDEIEVHIDGRGQVYLNDDPVDDATSAKLPELTSTLVDLRRNGEAAQSEVVVTLSADEDAAYQRVIDAMGALADANIPRVTFQAGAD